jgi:four helix bundle protein
MNEDIMNRNKNINRGYRKLDVWKDAIEWYVFVKTKIRNLKEVPYKVKAQIEDSAFSCHSNIAEGYSRRSLKENIQFNTIALASLAENYSQVFAIYEGNDIEKEWFDEYDQKHYSLENKLINYNKSQIRLLQQNYEWRSDYIIKEIVEKYENKED